MCKTLTPWSPACNDSIKVQLSGDGTNSDNGDFLLRKPSAVVPP